MYVHGTRCVTNRFEVYFMKQKAKVFLAAIAAAAMVFAGFLLGILYTYHCMLGIGFVKAVNVLIHGDDDRFSF